MSVPQIVLVTTEPATESGVIAALKALDETIAPSVCSDLAELSAALDRPGVEAALIDIDPAPQRMLEAMEPLARRFGGTRFIVLSGQLRSDLVTDSLNAGARQFLVKQSIRSDLGRAIKRLLPHWCGSPAGCGMAITVLSAGGGCGATTVAVNLANELAIQQRAAALVVDLDGAYGAVASYLGLSGEYGIADVLSHGHSIDVDLVKTTCLQHDDNLHALISPASVSLGDSHPLPMEHMGTALRTFRQAYAVTVVDAPRLPMSAAARLASESDITLIVFQQTVKDIRVVRSMTSALAQRGVRAELVMPVASRYRKRGRMVPMEEIEKALGRDSIARVANDFPAAVAAINFGQPLAQAAPHSSLRNEIRRLAGEVLASQATTVERWTQI